MESWKSESLNYLISRFYPSPAKWPPLATRLLLKGLVCFLLFSENPRTASINLLLSRPFFAHRIPSCLSLHLVISSPVALSCFGWLRSVAFFILIRGRAANRISYPLLVPVGCCSVGCSSVQKKSTNLGDLSFFLLQSLHLGFDCGFILCQNGCFMLCCEVEYGSVRFKSIWRGGYGNSASSGWRFWVWHL